jgi:hypothetical protein
LIEEYLVHPIIIPPTMVAVELKCDDTGRVLLIDCRNFFDENHFVPSCYGMMADTKSSSGSRHDG